MLLAVERDPDQERRRGDGGGGRQDTSVLGGNLGNTILSAFARHIFIRIVETVQPSSSGMLIACNNASTKPPQFHCGQSADTNAFSQRLFPSRDFGTPPRPPPSGSLQQPCGHYRALPSSARRQPENSPALNNQLFSTNAQCSTNLPISFCYDCCH